MRAPHGESLIWYLVLASLVPTSQAITLSQFQHVAGFSQACMDAYNTPLAGCTANDFIHGNPCSSSCIGFLRKLTVTVQAACQGSNSPSDSLMGMLLSGEAVVNLCPNVADSSEPRPGGDGDGTGSIVAASTSCTSSVTSLQPSAVKSSTSITTTKTDTRTFVSTPVSSVTRAATSSALAPTDSSITVILRTTEPDPQPTVLPPESTIPLSVLTSSPSQTATAIAQTTSSSKNSNGKPDGAGGGTLLDLTSSSCRIAKTSWMVRSILVSALILACLL